MRICESVNVWHVPRAWESFFGITFLLLEWGGRMCVWVWLCACTHTMASVFLYAHSCVCMYMCMCRYTCVYVQISMYVCICVWTGIVHLIFWDNLSYWDLGLTSSPTLAGHWDPSVSASPVLELQVYTPNPDVYVVLRTRLRASCLHSKHKVDWAISWSQITYLNIFSGIKDIIYFYFMHMTALPGYMYVKCIWKPESHGIPWNLDLWWLWATMWMRRTETWSSGKGNTYP